MLTRYASAPAFLSLPTKSECVVHFCKLLNLSVYDVILESHRLRPCSNTSRDVDFGFDFDFGFNFGFTFGPVSNVAHSLNCMISHVASGYCECATASNFMLLPPNFLRGSR